MPIRPARICVCGKRVAAGIRCPCATVRDRERPSARKRGYDTEWQALASEFLRHHRTCECGRLAVVVRHKQSIAKRPDLRLDPSNWLPGCASCNAKDAHRDRKTGSGSQLPGVGGRTARGISAGKSRNGLIFVADGDFDLEAAHGPRS